MDREGDVFVSLTDQDPRDVWEVMIALFDLEGFSSSFLFHYPCFEQGVVGG